MDLTTAQWHDRYIKQAEWTASLREFIFKQININSAGSVLEVGCGTGAVLSSLPNGLRSFGIDLQFEPLEFAANSFQRSAYVCGDAFHLPLADTSFDFTFCHYLLLWLKSPLDALQEMKRVTKPGGFVVAFAEPDHAGRIDYPPELKELGTMQSQSLEIQGVNLMSGRQLAGLFSKAGLNAIVAGVSGFQRQPAGLPEWFMSEWQMLEHDLIGKVDAAELTRYRALDERTWNQGSRVLWVPTFYAFGRV